jgi:general secretion pathway protein D
MEDYLRFWIWERGSAILFTAKCIATSALFLSVFLAIPAHAEKGQLAYKQGRDLEATQNYESAYEAYQRAYDANPRNTQYRASLTRIRFLAAAAKVHRAALLRQAGQLGEALLLFEEAAKIDPSSPIASQEVVNTRRMMQQTRVGHSESWSQSEPGVSPDLSDALGPVSLSGVSNVPITLKMSEDSKVVYQTVGKLAGLNVLFDPDYSSRRVNIELNAVTLQEALELLAAESKTFWKPMTTNTIFIAADNPAKRKELEENVIKSFYLSNLSAPSELQDIVNTLRTILEVSRVQQLASQEAVVIRGTPDQILLAEKIIHDFDRAAPEIVVDFALMQVSRDKVHTLGISPPTSASLQLQPNVTTSTTSTTTTTATSSTCSSSSTSTDCINLNTFANLNATDFVATLSGASASALFTDSSTKIIQNPQLRSVDGQKASIKIGERVPVATGTSTSAISGVSLTGLNTTQFQYIDVGVNVDITPRIHADGEVTLKVSVDVSSVTSYETIGGISEPVIGQRKVEHEIRLKDGEVSLIGGMLEQDDTRSLTGYPGLSQIPVLKYLFSQKNTEVTDTEVVFAVIPHIVRRKDLNELNNKTLDVGTGTSIRLRHAPKPAVEPAAVKTSEASPAANAPGEASPAMGFDPPAISVAKGATFTLNVVLSDAQNVHSIPLQIAYDEQNLALLNVSSGDLLSRGKQIVALVHREDAAKGTTEIAVSRPPQSDGVSGSGVVTTLTFQAKKAGRFPVRITKAAIVQSDGQAINAPGAETMISVQ